MRSVLFGLSAILLLVSFTFAAEVEQRFAFPEDWEWNSGLSMEAPASGYGTPSGWGTHLITTVQNNEGYDVELTELAWPIAGPSSNWYVWVDVGGLNPPSGDWNTADYTDSFTPADTDGSEHLPTVYSYVDVSGEGIVIADGDFLCFGYENPGCAGLTDYTGVGTWSWWSGAWDSDTPYGITSLHQVKGNYISVAVQPTSLGKVKATFK